MTELEAMKILKARERQEDRSVPTRLDRSRWEGCEYCKGVTGWTQDLDEEHHEVEFLFCPVCGRPLTEEAWAELDKRIQVPPPPNDPLTLEELREMDGEPVWLVGVSSINNFRGHWDICNLGGDSPAFPYCGENPDINLYGIMWKAYRRRPEEGTREN